MCIHLHVYNMLGQKFIHQKMILSRIENVKFCSFCLVPDFGLYLPLSLVVQPLMVLYVPKILHFFFP